MSNSIEENTETETGTAGKRRLPLPDRNARSTFEKRIMFLIDKEEQGMGTSSYEKAELAAMQRYLNLEIIVKEHIPQETLKKATEELFKRNTDEPMQRDKKTVHTFDIVQDNEESLQVTFFETGHSRIISFVQRVFSRRDTKWVTRKITASIDDLLTVIQQYQKTFTAGNTNRKIFKAVIKRNNEEEINWIAKYIFNKQLSEYIQQDNEP